jgi:hypothetical protein
MKRISLSIAILMVFMIASVPVKTGTSEAVLTAGQVSSAADIEASIQAVTHNGTQPGTLTLDSSQGDFVYSGEDRTIDRIKVFACTVATCP